MDKSVPVKAAKILDFIGAIEAPRGYTTVYGNNQSKLTKQITSMTLDELIGHQKGFTKAFGSSASGRYQFMRNTLLDLKKEMKLSGKEIFNGDFQDRLGHRLLVRRGYNDWARSKISHDQFMINLAKEWASFPVPFDMKGQKRQVARGQSFYAGDGLNKSLVRPDYVWTTLAKVHDMNEQTPDGIMVAEGPIGEQIAVPPPVPTVPEPPLIKPEGNAKSFYAALGKFFSDLANKG